MIPVFRPKLPTVSELIPYLKCIDDARWYSNFGPLSKDFIARLAEYFRVGSDQVVLVSNATVGISLALRAVALERSRRQCLCPAWTFAATPHAILSAGLSPVFSDVDPITWTLDPDQFQDQDIVDASAVVVVSPFGGSVDMVRWERFTERHGIPVVCDAAASFDAVGRLPEFRIGSIPIVISLHATKPLAAGEGAIIVCADPDIIERIRQMSNFGFSTTSVSQIAGTNAKVSEYVCAVGLASLDKWPETRERLASLRRFYLDCLSGIAGVTPFAATCEHVSNYIIVQTEWNALQLSNYLTMNGVETRRWWRGGCHQHPAFAAFNVRPLPQTWHLGTHTLGLPFFIDLEETEIKRIADLVRKWADSNGRASCQC